MYLSLLLLALVQLGCAIGCCALAGLASSLSRWVRLMFALCGLGMLAISAANARLALSDRLVDPQRIAALAEQLALSDRQLGIRQQRIDAVAGRLERLKSETANGPFTPAHDRELAEIAAEIDALQRELAQRRR